MGKKIRMVKYNFTLFKGLRDDLVLQGSLVQSTIIESLYIELVGQQKVGQSQKVVFYFPFPFALKG